MVRVFCTAVLIFCTFLPLTACSEESGAEVPFISAEEIAGFARTPLKVVTQDGRDLIFQVEIADSPQEIMQGLMFRKQMAANHGMIFLFHDLRPRSFWMRNTYIPLDLVYVGEQGRIVSIKKGIALNESMIPSDYPAQAVIELNYGTAAMLNIQPGDIVHFSRLKY